MSYPFMTLSKLESYMPEIIRLKVSVKARSPSQFVQMFKQHGMNLPVEWIRKRNAFITRTNAAYQLKPSPRRLAALRCWAFEPS